MLNKQNREENNWIWSLKDLEYLAFNLFLNFTDSLKFISRKLIYELYQHFQVNPICRGRQEENYPLPTASINKIFELFTVLVDMLVNFAAKYNNIKQLLTRSFDGSDLAQLPCGKKATVGV